MLKLYHAGAETKLHTDACSVAHGAILMQRDSGDNVFRPVYYSSGKISPAEEKCTSYDPEVLAIVKALKKFRVYLLGIPFNIITDCRAFALTMRKKDLRVRVARWATLLEEFDYKVEHRPWISMMHDEALSRNPLPEVMLIDEDERGMLVRLREAQLQENHLQIRDNIEQHDADGHVLKNGILYREIKDTPLLVVPKSMQTQVVRRGHERGHFGITKSEALLKRHYYWFKGMREKVGKGSAELH